MFNSNLMNYFTVKVVVVSADDGRGCSTVASDGKFVSEAVSGVADADAGSGEWSCSGQGLSHGCRDGGGASDGECGKIQTKLNIKRIMCDTCTKDSDPSNGVNFLRFIFYNFWFVFLREGECCFIYKNMFDPKPGILTS